MKLFYSVFPLTFNCNSALVPVEYPHINGLSTDQNKNFMLLGAAKQNKYLPLQLATNKMKLVC